MTDKQKLEFEKIFAKHCEKLGISKLCRENKKAEQLESLMFICEDFITTLDEQSEKKLKEFNVEEYYKNPERKVVTRDGREVEILKIDTKTKTNVPVIAMMDGNDIRFFTSNGRLSLERETCSDLFFADDNCDTCTNDKGCVACENGELYQGNPTDYAKSNEEKAKEIAKEHEKYTEDCRVNLHLEGKSKVDVARETAYAAAIDMAEWKDEQFEAEKQQLIDKACDAYCKVCGHYHHTVPYKICRHDCNYYDDFKKHLKGE